MPEVRSVIAFVSQGDALVLFINANRACFFSRELQCYGRLWVGVIVAWHAFFWVVERALFLRFCFGCGCVLVCL